MVADLLNKRVVNEFMQYPRWWEPVTAQEDFASLQQVKWITLGGVGELPTVAELVDTFRTLLEGKPLIPVYWEREGW